MNQLRNPLITLFIALLTCNSALAHEDKLASLFPSYKDGKLTIPRVDTDLQAGSYQDVELQFNTTAGAWELINYREALITPDSYKDIYIDSIEVIQQGNIPIQLFLKISGDFSTSCGKFGQINQRIEGNRFAVTLHTAPIPPLVLCGQALVLLTRLYR